MKTTVTFANGNVTIFNYDTLGRMTQKTERAMGKRVGEPASFIAKFTDIRRPIKWLKNACKVTVLAKDPKLSHYELQFALSLRIASKTLSCAQITKILGLPPTEQLDKGTPYSKRYPKRVREEDFGFMVWI